MNTDLEWFHMNLPKPDTLTHVCNYKQPILFDTQLPCIIDNASLAHSLHIQDGVGVHLPIKDALTLFKSGTFGSFQNTPPLSFMNQYNALNEALQPKLTSATYDFITGSDSFTTPLRKIYTHRTFFMVTKGSATVTCSPTKGNLLTIVVQRGQVVFIPTFWWFSIQLHHAFVISVAYDTLLNKLVRSFR